MSSRIPTLRFSAPAPRERRFDTTPRKAIGDALTFLYDETGLPLRQSARTLVTAPNPVPCTLAIPAQLSVGDELAFDPQLGPFWHVTRIIHTLSPATPARHVWLSTPADLARS